MEEQSDKEFPVIRADGVGKSDFGSFTKEAIRRSLEGGYFNFRGDIEDIYAYVRHQILLDPLFWQALGKAEGWEREFVMASFGTTGKQEGGYGFDKWIFDGDSSNDFSLPRKTTPEWKYRMHSFIDHIAEGKDIDSFFNELLK